MNTKQYFVYILTNKWNILLYPGITSNLIKRLYKHKQKFVSGFTKNITLINWFTVKFLIHRMRR